jgi:2-dehydro-3-deoxyphosphogalactonate aldolase
VFVPRVAGYAEASRWTGCSQVGGVKVFPSQQVGPGGLKAWREVLPPDVELLPVGGVDPGSMAGWVAAGATGFGVGSALYRAGRDLADLGTRAAALVEAWHACTSDADEEGWRAR